MHVPPSLASLTMTPEHRAYGRAKVGFLRRIWADHDDRAYTFLAARSGKRWIEHSIRGRRKNAIEEFLEEHDPHVWDVYFCPNAFSQPNRKTSSALPTPFAWCDIDDSNPAAFKPSPNILWETSIGRYQGIWCWNEMLPPHTAEQISKGLLRFGGDKGGWSITKYLRVPGTINHKPERNRDQVRLLRFNPSPQPVPDFPISQGNGLAVSADELDPSRFEIASVVTRYRRKVSLFARSLMEARRVIYPDRSEAIYVIASELICAGADNDEIACVLLDNPHFVEKHGANLAMAEREIFTIRAKLGDDQ